MPDHTYRLPSYSTQAILIAGLKESQILKKLKEFLTNNRNRIFPKSSEDQSINYVNMFLDWLGLDNKKQQLTLITLAKKYGLNSKQSVNNKFHQILSYPPFIKMILKIIDPKPAKTRQYGGENKKTMKILTIDT